MATNVKVLALLVIFISSTWAKEDPLVTCQALADQLFDSKLAEKGRVNAFYDFVKRFLPDGKFDRSTLAEAIVNVREGLSAQKLQAEASELNTKEIAIVKEILEGPENKLDNGKKTLMANIEAKINNAVKLGIATLKFDTGIKNFLVSFYNNAVVYYNAIVKENPSNPKLKGIHSLLSKLKDFKAEIDARIEEGVEDSMSSIRFFDKCLRTNLPILLSNNVVEEFNASKDKQIGVSMRVALEFFELMLQLEQTDIASNLVNIIESYIKIGGSRSSSVSNSEFRGFISRLNAKFFPYLKKTDESVCFVIFTLTAYALGDRQGTKASSYMDFAAGYFNKNGLNGILSHKGELRQLLLFQFVASASITSFNIDESSLNRAQLLEHIDEVLETPDEAIAKLAIYGSFGLYRSIIIGDSEALNDFFVVFMETVNSYLIGASRGASLEKLHLGLDAYLNTATGISHGEYLLIKLYNAIFAVNNFDLGSYTFEFKSESAGFSAKVCKAYRFFIAESNKTFNFKKWALILQSGHSDVKGIKELMSMSGEVTTQSIKFITSRDMYIYKPSEVIFFTEDEYEELLEKHGNLEVIEEALREEGKDFKAVLIKKKDGQIIDIKHEAVVGENGQLIEVEKSKIGMEVEQPDEETQPEEKQPTGEKGVRKAKNKGQEDIDEQDLFGADDQESPEKITPDRKSGLKGKEELIGGKHDYNVPGISTDSENKTPFLGEGDHDRLNAKTGKNRVPLLGEGDHDRLGVEAGKNRVPLLGEGDHDKVGVEAGEKTVPLSGEGDKGKIKKSKNKGPLLGEGDHDLVGVEKKNVILNKAISITIEECKIDQLTTQTPAKKQADPVFTYYTVLDGETEEISRSHFYAIFAACGEIYDMDKSQLLDEALPEPEPFEGEVETGVTQKTEVSHTVDNCDISTSRTLGNKETVEFFFEVTEEKEQKEVSRERFLEIIKDCKEKGFRYGPGFSFFTNDAEPEKSAEIEEEKPDLTGLVAIVNQSPETPRIERGQHIVITHKFIDCYSSSSTEETSSEAPEDKIYTKYVKVDGDNHEPITLEQFEALEDSCYEQIKEKYKYDEGFYKVITNSLDLEACSKSISIQLHTPGVEEGRQFEKFIIEDGESKEEVSEKEWRAAFIKCNSAFLVRFKKTTLNEDCGQAIETSNVDRRTLDFDPIDTYIVIEDGVETAMLTLEAYEKKVKDCLARRSASLVKPSVKIQIDAQDDTALPSITGLKIKHDDVLKAKIAVEEFKDDFDEDFDPSKFEDRGKDKVFGDEIDVGKRVSIKPKKEEPKKDDEAASKKKKNKNKFEGDNENDLEGDITPKPKEKAEGLDKVKPAKFEIDEGAMNNIKKTIDNLSDEDLLDFFGESEEKEIPVTQPKLDGELPTLELSDVFEDGVEKSSPKKNNVEPMDIEDETPTPEKSIYTDEEVIALSPKEKLEKLLKGELSKPQNEKVMKDEQVLDIIRKDPALWLRKMYKVSLNCRDCFLQFFEF